MSGEEGWGVIYGTRYSDCMYLSMHARKYLPEVRFAKDGRFFETVSL